MHPPQSNRVPSFLRGLVFRVLPGPAAQAAIQFRDEIYEAELGSRGADGFDQRAAHLVAENSEGQLVAVARLVRPEQRPFGFERFIRVPLLDRAPRPAEIGRFCVRRDYRPVRRAPFIHIGMLKLAHAYAQREALSDFLILSLPHLVQFYERAAFRKTGLGFTHPVWGPVHLMHLSVGSLRPGDSRLSPLVEELLFRWRPANILV